MIYKILMKISDFLAIKHPGRVDETKERYVERVKGDFLVWCIVMVLCIGLIIAWSN